MFQKFYENKMQIKPHAHAQMLSTFVFFFLITISHVFATVLLINYNYFFFVCVIKLVQIVLTVSRDEQS